MGYKFRLRSVSCINEPTCIRRNDIRLENPLKMIPVCEPALDGREAAIRPRLLRNELDFLGRQIHQHVRREILGLLRGSPRHSLQQRNDGDSFGHDGTWNRSMGMRL